jgi:CPA2 family monovalent cation:H+ antiporter-2
MPHDITLISTLAAAFGLAIVFGYVAVRLKMPPLVGYLLAGIAIGPATPGFVADMGLSAQLAEIGVMLLMFGVGLHFSLDDLLSVKKIAIPGALLQILVATVLGGALSWIWGWSLGGSIVFGLCLSVASTVVLLRALEAKGLVDSTNGRIAIGWLVVEDLVMVLVLVLLPALAGALKGGADVSEGAQGSIALVLGITTAKIVGFMVFMLFLGRKVLPKALWLVAKTGSRELFTLAVVAVAIGVAFGAASLFSVSFALGAFFAGMVMRESEFSHRAADESLPLRDAFAVLFFVSVGMLFDPHILVQEPLRVLAVLGVIVVGKTLAAITLVLVMRYPLNSAFTIGASLAQIGEFSFILAGLGVGLGLMPREGQSLVLAGAILSIAINPVLFAVFEPFQGWIRRKSSFARSLDQRVDPLARLPNSVDPSAIDRQVVVVGAGDIGMAVCEALKAANVKFLVAEQQRELVDSLRRDGIHAVCGDASTPEVLVQAHVARASMLLITVPDILLVRSAVSIARTLNPGIRIVVQAESLEEARMIENEGLAEVLTGETELAKAMAQRATDFTPTV